MTKSKKQCGYAFFDVKSTEFTSKSYSFQYQLSKLPKGAKTPVYDSTKEAFCWEGWEPFQVQDFGKFQRFWFKRYR